MKQMPKKRNSGFGAKANPEKTQLKYHLRGTNAVKSYENLAFRQKRHKKMIITLFVKSDSPKKSGESKCNQKLWKW